MSVPRLWRIRHLVWIVPLLGVLGIAAWDASARIRRSNTLSANYGVAVDAPARTEDSSTGYASHRRSLIFPTLSPDAMHWVMQTQAMVATGSWRVRWTSVDNAPDGRPVHWSAPYRWWLFLLAQIEQKLCGTPLPIAIERSALWAGPVLLVLFAVVLVPLVARQLGPFPAAIVAIGLAGNPAVTDQFLSGNADHHGLATICAFSCVCFLVFGSEGRRRWLAVSASCGALGFWISAVTMAPILAAILVGSLVVSLRQPVGLRKKLPLVCCPINR